MEKHKTTITILESQVTGKKNTTTCEDGLVVTDAHVAVIDGSTSKCNIQMEQGLRNGKLAMLLLQEVVRSLPSDASLAAFCHAATCKFQATYIEHGMERKRLMSHPEERLTASIALYSLYYDEIWLVGDCQCIVDNQLYDNPKPDEERIALKRSEIINRMLDTGEADINSLRQHDLGRDAIVGEIVETCRSQNISFSVVDGFDVAMDKVRVIPVHRPCELVMGTDGYPFLLPTLKESEQALAQLLCDDPMCINQYKATKGMMEGQSSFDDRTYIRFVVR